MKVAVIGAGISGLATAAELHAKGHSVTVFEKNKTIGGHAQTIEVPVGTTSMPVELGVFMHDPVELHPLMHSYAEKLALSKSRIKLSFSFENSITGYTWDTRLIADRRRRLLPWLRNTVRAQALGKMISFLFSLNSLIKSMQAIRSSPDLRRTSLGEYYKGNRLSAAVLNEYLYPQLLCWWGITKENVDDISIQVIVDSMVAVKGHPQYIFTQGWSQLIQGISSSISTSILTNCAVKKVRRCGGQVQLFYRRKSQLFDHVVLSTPPVITKKLIEAAGEDELAILDKFTCVTTKVMLHSDTNWMPKASSWSLINLIQNEKGSFITLWYGSLHPDKPPLFITWGDALKEEPDPAKLIREEHFLRTLPTIDYLSACKEIAAIQGRGRIWHCGAHVDALSTPDHDAIPSLWHENALKSGLAIAHKIHQRST